MYCALGFELQKESTLTYEVEFSLAPQREKWCLKLCVYVSTARGYARHYRIVFKFSVKLRVKFTISAFHVAIVRRRSQIDVIAMSKCLACMSVVTELKVLSPHLYLKLAEKVHPECILLRRP